MSENQTPEVNQSTENTAGEASGQVRTPQDVFIDTYISVVADKQSGKVTGKGNELVAERLAQKGYPVKADSIQQRATKCRSEGVPLPKMPRSGGQRNDPAAAKALVEAALAKYGIAQKGEEKQESGEGDQKADAPAE